MGSTVKKVAAVAIPIAAMAIPGVNLVAAGAIGGALGGLVSGGGLKGALIGGALGGFSGGIAKAGGFSNFFGGLTGGGSQAALGQAGKSIVMGKYGAGTMTNLGLTSGTLGSTAAVTGARAATLTPVVEGIKGPQSFLASKLASGGGYGPQLSSLSDKMTTLGQNVVGTTTTGGIRHEQLVEKQIFPGSGTGMKFDRAALKDMITAGYSGYQDDIRQKQLEALQSNLSGYRDEYAEYYSAEAKKHQEKLARGELPETYNAALDREAERLKRLLIAQGHNPAESGFGRDQFKRGLMDLESKFLGAERDYWNAVQTGASGMRAQIGLLQNQLATDSASNVGDRGTGQAVSTLLDKLV
tara:strand:- start:5562 stop:6626 length:1065 start_codon:yes stop_codon:yes gene_type:complete